MRRRLSELDVQLMEERDGRGEVVRGEGMICEEDEQEEAPSCGQKWNRLWPCLSP